MFSRSFSLTVKVCALLVLSVLIAAGALLSGPAGFGPGQPSAEAALLNEMKKLLASDASLSAWFGQSVAVSGDTAVVGAWGEDAGGGIWDDFGAAYVFQRDQGGADNWGEVKKLTASDAQTTDWFGLSVAVSGDTAVVGAYGEDAGGGIWDDFGAAYVFQRDQGGADNWGEVTKLLASDASLSAWFGKSVAVSGDTAVVGAVGADAAYVFQRNQGGADNWGQVKKLTTSSGGDDVAISGDTVVVGAYTDGTPGSAAGSAYVFQRDQGGADNWGQVKKLTASDAQAFDSFGVSVAVSGDTAVVGANQEDAGGSDAGAAYVFQRNQGGADNWGQVKKLTASNAGADDRFGWSVAVSGGNAVVGAWGEDAGGSNAGAAYVFQRNEGGAGNWGELEKLTASDAEEFDVFGSVAVSGDTAFVGAAWEDGGGGAAGAAYVFDLLQTKPTATPTSTPTATPTNTPTPTKQPFKGDTDGDGCADTSENRPKAEVADGGGRDYMNPWDYYDVNGDGVIDLLNDILGVIQHYQPIPGGAPPYDAAYDRGPTTGPNAWNMTAPDGVIDLLNDILSVITQYNPTGCT